MVMINQGRTAEVFDLGDRKILKLFRKGFPQPAIEDECRVAAAMNDCALPVPKYFGHIEQDGRTGLIYEYIDGVSMIKRVMDAPWKLRAYGRKMAECHAAIHRTVVEGIPRRKEQLNFFINHTDLMNEGMKKAVLEKLEELPDGRCLLHGDLHPDNIMLADEKPIVIDWMTAASGDPACDVARTYILLKLGTIPKFLPWITRVTAFVFKSLLADVYLRRYLKITGIRWNAVQIWLLPVAAARLFENVSPEENEVLLGFVQKELKKKKV